MLPAVQPKGFPILKIFTGKEVWVLDISLPTEKLDVNGNTRIRNLTLGSKVDDYVGAYSDGCLRRMPEYLPRVMNLQTIDGAGGSSDIGVNTDFVIVTNIYRRMVWLPNNTPIGKVIYFKKYGPSGTSYRLSFYNYIGTEIPIHISGGETVALVHKGINQWEILLFTRPQYIFID